MVSSHRSLDTLFVPLIVLSTASCHAGPVQSAATRVAPFTAQEAAASQHVTSFASPTLVPSPLDATSPPTSTLATLPFALEGTPVPFPEMPISADNADHIVALARWGKGWPQAADLSPDDAMLAIGASAGLYLYDLETLTEVQFPLDSSVNDVAFNPDGRQLALGTDTALQLWDVETGRLLLAFDEEGPVFSVAFSPDGGVLAIASHSAVRLWNTRSGELDFTIDGDTQSPMSIAFSPDGTMLAFGSWFEEGAQLWDLTTRSVLFELSGELHDTQWNVTFSPDSRVLATASFSQVRLWDTSTGVLLASLPQRGVFGEVAFSPDGQTVYCPGEELQAWSLAGHLLRAYGEPAYDVFVPAHGGSLISFRGPEIQYWDAATGAPLAALDLPGYASLISSVAFSPDDLAVASGSVDDIIRVWNVAAGDLEVSFEANLGAVNVVSFDPTGSMLATGGCMSVNTGDGLRCLQGSVVLWDWRIGEAVRSLPGDTWDVTHIGFAPDGETLASNGADGTIWFWDVNSGEVTSQWPQAGYPFAFGPGTRTFVSVGDGSVRFWDLASGHVARDFPVPRSDLLLALSPDGDLIATTDYWDHTIYVWDAQTGRLAHTLWGHQDNVDAIAFSQDGTLLVSSGFDETIRLWDVASGLLLRTLPAPTRWVTSIVLSHDGRLMATGDAGGTIRLWGVR